MELKINNFAKIKEANIELNGITVIAGDNNTGKSTIGKILFSIFNSMNNMNEKIEQERKNAIYKIAMQSFQQKLPINKQEYSININKNNLFARHFAKYVVESFENDKKIEDTIREFIKTKLVMEIDNYKEKFDVEDFVEYIESRLKPLINLPDNKIMAEIITRCFDRVFEGQISPLINDSLESTINLLIKTKDLKLNFKNDQCVNWQAEFNILHEAFYIDNPFIIDDMSNEYSEFINKHTNSHLLKNLCKKENDILKDIFDSVLIKDKVDDIYNVLNKVIEGDIIKNQNNEYCLKSNKYINPLNIKNLSTGIKSFAIINQLLTNGSLKEKDVLILDEPEIHLHPEWQLIYAELIVLLQKEFELTIVITTHSPYFLDAIEIFAAKYAISDRTNYYLAENDGLVSVLHDVTNDIDIIYKKLSDPMQMLENMRNRIYTEEV